ncbi:MAG TPA: DUF1697 domain-containing protein [Pyrinomonadaceae bacterium]|nr:DUF1697 domain-containing protein [Pyrinomonadaceae bacterium]
MITYVALLRGINVGGNKLIKMADLREVFESSGFKSVRTYIQSGNVIFETRDSDADKVVRKIEKAIYQSLGHEVTVILRTVAELKNLVEGDHFKHIESEEDVMRFVTFMSAEPLRAPRLPFVIPKENAEILVIRNRTAFLACRRKPNGMFSFPNAFFEKEFGVSATTRNWNTVNKILELVKRLDGPSRPGRG